MKKNLAFLIRHAFVVAFGLSCLWVFAKIILCPFTDWNFPAEGVSADFMNFFWHDNFHFFRLPHFTWRTDYMLYPYGIDATFFFWSFEMNLFGSWMRALDFAPWGQCYYLLSLVVTFFGVYALLWRRKGRGWATFFAFVLTFCNYAAICKYPGHFSHCIVHWGILSVLLDVILVEKFWNDEHVSARYFLTRILLLLLCLGLELGYIAGFACFSFFVTCVYLFLSKIVQTKSLPAALRWVLGELKNIVRTFPASRWNYLIVVAILLVAWIYVPIVLQIMANTPPQEKTPVWGTNPLRIFHPILPDFNPAITYTTQQGILGVGIVDTVYAWSAGLSILLTCYFGIVVGGMKGMRKWLPFIAMLGGAMLMRYIPIITYFPAFTYARIPERFSPYLVCLLMIPLIFIIGQTEWQNKSKKVLMLVGLPIFLFWIVELGTAYFCVDTAVFGQSILEKCAPQVAKNTCARPICKSRNTFVWTDIYRITPFDEHYLRSVEIVKNLPGAALFFMPFAANDGDGHGFLKYQCLISHQMQFAAQCNKKVNGCYIGRMFREIDHKEFYQFPWDRYITNEVWTAEMWDKLNKFLSSADFAACIIDTTKLTPDQVTDIVQHLGKPISSFDMNGDQYAVIPLTRN